MPHDKFHRFLFPFSSKFPDLNFAPYVLYIRGAPARAKRAWDKAPYSWNMVNLFSFGCHVTDRAYVRTYASTDCTGRVGETIKRKGGCLRPVLASPHLLYMTITIWSIDSCQNRIATDQYPMTISRAHVSTHRGVACAASVSSQGSSRKLGQEQQKKNE